MKAALYVFAYTGLTAETHICITKELSAWPDLVHGTVSNDALIERSRSKAASHFLIDPSMGDVMLMLDHDMIWKKGDLKYLAEKALETKGIVAGLYSKRAFHQGMTFRIEEPCRFEIGEDRLIPATFVSTGFIAIHRRVIEHITKDMKPVIQGFYPVFLPMVVETKHGLEHLSEDWAMCYRAQSMPIHIAAKIKLRHEGFYQYRMLDSLTEPPSDETISIEITHNSAIIKNKEYSMR